MLILNINGPINAGKTTVSKILAERFPKALFIEVDDLMSGEEEKRLGLTKEQGWQERQKRLYKKLQEYQKVIGG